MLPVFYLLPVPLYLASLAPAAASRVSPLLSAPARPDTAATGLLPPARAVLAGTVVDEMNNPMAGVTVRLTTGTSPPLCITNSQGRYLLEVPPTGGSIAVSFAGYHSQELTFRRAGEIDVVLQPLPGFHRDRKQRVIYRRHHRSRAQYPGQ